MFLWADAQYTYKTFFLFGSKQCSGLPDVTVTRFADAFDSVLEVSSAVCMFLEHLKRYVRLPFLCSDELH